MFTWPTVPPYIPTIDNDVNFYLQINIWQHMRSGQEIDNYHTDRTVVLLRMTQAVQWLFYAYIWSSVVRIKSLELDDSSNIIADKI